MTEKLLSEMSELRLLEPAAAYNIYNTMTEKLLSEIAEVRLLEPAVAYNIYNLSGVSHDRVILDHGEVIRSARLPAFLMEAKEVAMAVGTIGPRLEERVTDYFQQGEPLRGVLLDGIGSAAVDSLTQEICRIIMVEASSRGYQAGSPISPGMPGLPLTEQSLLLEMATVQEIGVSLTPAGVMVPRKSASMVIGMGPQMKTWTPAEVCTRCRLSKTCLYKIPAAKGNKARMGRA
jgi:hypothetical protein